MVYLNSKRSGREHLRPVGTRHPEHSDLIIDDNNGDVACNSYHKYKEDVQLLKNMEVCTM